MIIFHSSRIDKYNFYGNSQTCTFFSASVYDYFSLFNKRQMQLPWQCIFFTQVGGLFNSISTMKFSPIFISIVMAFTSSLASGLTCAVGAEPVCVTERKCELPEHGGRCVPQQVCDCVQPSRSRGLLPNFRPGGENLFVTTWWIKLNHLHLQ